MRTKYSLCLVIFMCCNLFLTSQVINGDFQNAGNVFGNCHAGGTWIVPSNSLCPQYVVSLNNNAWIDITPCNSFGNGAYLEQSVTTIPGQKYHFQMDLATCYGWQIWDSGLDIWINNAPLDTGINRLSNTSFSTTSCGSLLWKTVYTSTFIATGNATLLKIAGRGANPQNPTYMQGGDGPGVMGLDNVQLNTGNPIITGVSMFEGIDFVMYPQPASDKVKVRYAVQEEIHLSIHTMNGELIREGSTDEIFVGDLQEGLYLIKAENARGSKVLKLLVLHQ